MGCRFRPHSRRPWLQGIGLLHSGRRAVRSLQSRLSTEYVAREWKGAIASVIRSGVAAGNWLGPLLHDHRARAEASLGQTSLAAKTESDQKALQLLKNELSSLGEWDSNTQAMIHSLNAEQSVNPAATQNDPLLAKISECDNFLSAMLVDGEFADNPSCH